MLRVLKRAVVGVVLIVGVTAMSGTRFDEAGCLICDSYGTQHYDYNWFYQNNQHGGGGYHSQSGGGSYGECSAAHDWYARAVSADAERFGHLAERLAALSSTADKRLLTAFLESDHAVLNAQRQALQVSSGPLVLVHIPLTPSQFTELASAAAQMKGRTWATSHVVEVGTR